MLQKLGIFLEHRQRWFGLPLIVAMSLAALAIAIAQPRFLELIELKTLDARFHLRGVNKPDPNIIIVAVDDHSLERVGRWPWSRDKIGLIIDRVLGQYHARVIGLDMVFSEAQKNPLQESLERITLSGKAKPEITQWLKQHQNIGDIDEQFAAVLRKYHDRICMGYFFYPHGVSVSQNAVKQRAQSEKLLQPSAMTAQQDGHAPHIITHMQAVTNNLSIFSQAAEASGFFNFFPDSDGLVRHVPLVAELNGYYYPSLDLQTLRLALDWPSLSIRLSSNGVEELRLQDNSIETDTHGQMLINHYGPGHTFQYASAVDVLEGKANPVMFKDAIVLLGVTATGVFDTRPSPFDTVFPGVEAHATVISNILHHQELRRPTWLQVTELLSVLFVGLGCGWFVLGRGAVVQGVTLVGVPLLITLLAYWLFASYNIWLKEIYLILGILMAAAPATLIEYIIESRKRAFIHDAFAHFLAPHVVDELARHPETLRLGGEKKEITAMFSDIAGFSTFSESMHPEELVHFLNQYLSAMSDIILAHGGTIDKYEGDAIIAFFGAPLDMPDHAIQAVRVALAQQAQLQQLRKHWIEMGYPELHARIGVNSGPMIVGNIGTETHMNYTIMGDDANLASRLEGVNKTYGTSILISNHTYFEAQDRIMARFVDRVYVVGRKTSVEIYEPLGEQERVSAEDQSFSHAYEEAWMIMHKRQFEEAEAIFAKLAAERPDDGPSSVMLLRCRNFIQEPPPDNWDGVHRLTSK
ncbi:MAG: adenylate/guanylate cyclase domain-containing protein [Zetaproteobacteria bacterium]|nr:MAG: adenylate/guanylate cyclase domain-containing protein [Zetaproteobacteria bacterium]